MNKDQFWKIIQAAKSKSDGDLDDMQSILVDKLSHLDVPEIMAWERIFAEYLRLSYKDKLWAAAYVINGGCSDDGFDYFRGWLTAQGKAVFLKALKDPDSLADVEVEADEAFFEDMLAVAYEAYFKKEGITDRDYEKFSADFDKYPLSEAEKEAIVAEICYPADIDVKWDEDELPALLPRLGQKFD